MEDGLRLLMLSGWHPKGLLVKGLDYRWVRSNGHPGHCGEDCWHASPEAALACFQQEPAVAREAV